MLVRWEDNGWKIARIIEVKMSWMGDGLHMIQYGPHQTLVQHTCTGELEFIDIRITEPVPDRRD